nr:transposase (putative), gypsy type [Tanacetum cinerariifolium]
MVRDSVQLETAVNTISHEYQLEFTSEYGWMCFSKSPGKNTPQCYTKPLDSLKNWNNRFFWVDECVFPTTVEWRTNASKDGMSASGTYSVEAVRVLDTHRTPIQKQPEALLCLVGISRRYYLGDDVYLTFHYDDDREMDLFILIRAPNPTKVKTGSCPRAPHELPLLTLTAPRVIEMDEPAAATDSSGVPSAIERSPLDFADEVEASCRETAAPEMPPPEEVPITTVPGGNQAAKTITVEPPAVLESRKRGHEGIDANAPPNDPDPLAFADAPSPHPADVAQSSQGVAVAEDPKSENVSSPTEVGSPGSVYRPEWGVTNGSLLDTPEVDALQQQVFGEERLKAAFEDYKWQQDQMVEQRCVEMDARLDAMSIDFDEE